MVKKGDTLYDLAKKYQVDLQKLIELNPQIDDPNQIEVGEKVKIPSSPGKIKFANIPQAIDKAKDKAFDSVKDTVKNTVKYTVDHTKTLPKQMMQNIGFQSESEEIPVKKAKENKAHPITKVDQAPHSFDQIETPSKKVGSFYDMPEIEQEEEASPWGIPYSFHSQQAMPSYGEIEHFAPQSNSPNQSPMYPHYPHTLQPHWFDPQQMYSHSMNPYHYAYPFPQSMGPQPSQFFPITPCAHTPPSYSEWVKQLRNSADETNDFVEEEPDLTPPTAKKKLIVRSKSASTRSNHRKAIQRKKKRKQLKKSQPLLNG